jgi:predicted nuclease with TOPRIM domain
MVDFLSKLHEANLYSSNLHNQFTTAFHQANHEFDEITSTYQLNHNTLHLQLQRSVDEWNALNNERNGKTQQFNEVKHCVESYTDEFLSLQSQLSNCSLDLDNLKKKTQRRFELEKSKKNSVFPFLTPNNPAESSGINLSAGTINSIFTHLGVRDISSSTAACKAWAEAINKSKLWLNVLKRVQITQKKLQTQQKTDRNAKATPRKTISRPTSSQQPSNPSNHLSPAATSSPVTPTTPNSASAVSPGVVRPDSALAGTPAANLANAAASAFSATASILKKFGVKTGNSSAESEKLAHQIHINTDESIFNSSHILENTNPANSSQSSANSSAQEENSQEEFDAECPPHLHYSLSIEIPSRDVYTITVGSVLTKNSRSCMELLDSVAKKARGEVNSVSPGVSTDKSQRAVVILSCSIHPRGLENELMFCQQLTALHNSLNSTKFSNNKAVSTLESEEQQKKQLISAISSAKNDLAAVSSELHNVEQQNESDKMTKSFLLENLATIKQQLSEEQSQTASLGEKLTQHIQSKHELLKSKQSEAAGLESQLSQLKQQKSLLSKEAKTLQGQLAGLNQEKEAMKQQYQQLLSTIQSLKAV